MVINSAKKKEVESDFETIGSVKYSLTESIREGDKSYEHNEEKMQVRFGKFHGLAKRCEVFVSV